MPDLAQSMQDMFIAFGRRADDGRADIYIRNIQKEIDCDQCSALACHQSILNRNTLPAYKLLYEQAIENLSSNLHAAHIMQPQLAPQTETFWRSDAVKLVLPACDGDRDLAAFIVAQIWWNQIPAFGIPEEMEKYAETWVGGAKQYLDGKPSAVMVQRAFERARWAYEHSWDLTEIPDYIRDLEPAP
jgi:hypothetical protein